jgi:hypothetical protein
VSQENVEVACRAFSLVSRGDLESLSDLIGPGFEVRENVLAPDAAVYYGPDRLKKSHDGNRARPRLARWTMYQDKAEALKAVRLEE